MTDLTHSTSTATLVSNQYQYNDANNISSWTNASGNHAYSYDPVDRLTSATNSTQPNESYSFDGVGNRTASHLSASYSYQPFNKLTSTATATYSYDNHGNLLSKIDASGTTNFTWNEENQLTQVALPNGLTVNYKYDALGRRIQRTTSTGANERYVYDGADVLLDLNADWSVATTYLNGPEIDNHFRKTNSVTGISYYLTDHLGSTAGMTDASGSLVEANSYDSFGNSAGSLLTRYDYTGRERDPGTGLLHYRARWYDPQVGRFIAEDPISFQGGDINLYGYVVNNPTNFRDPTGRQRADRDRPGDIEWARDLKKAIDRMPPPGPGFYPDMMRRRVDGHNRFPGEPNSAMRHCVISCESAREWGTWPSRAMGMRNEAQGVALDVQRVLRRRPMGAFQFRDLLDNERGFDCSSRIKGTCCKTCEDCCSGACGPPPKKLPSPRLTAWDKR